MPIDLDGLVAGEPLRLLLQALSQMEMTPGADGAVTVQGQLSPEADAALRRALARVEAEAASTDGGDNRADASLNPESAEDARADAFTVLLRRVMDAAEA
jgi:hypothetical protein